MKEEYQEQEVKILDIDIEKVKKNLERIGAKKVYEDYREIITLDTEDRQFLMQKDKLIRITDEGTIKVTMHIHQSHPEIKREIKFKVSRMKEALDFFSEMGLEPIARVQAYRISYELGKVDFDIDKFPSIPPFLEIDQEFLKTEGYTLASLLEELELNPQEFVIMGTEDIHNHYGIDYFEEYKIKKEKY